jgi:cytochrome c peroxidase
MPCLSPRTRCRLRAPALLLIACLLGLPAAQLLACGGDEEKVGTDTRYPLVYGDHPTVAQLAALGRRLFFDPGLSASGRQSCASCHSPAHGFGPPNALPVQPGGAAMDRFGFRNTPSIAYLHSPIAFTEHFYETEVSGRIDDAGPTGGRMWDGRVNTAHDQALMPLLDPNEMANPDRAAVFERLRRTAYADAFRAAVSAPGENVFDDPDAALAWMAIALESYEQGKPFRPFTSKYDAYLRDQATLTPAERRGLALFNDRAKGNCASCHSSATDHADTAFPLFTDFGYVALGVPRNGALPANRDPAFHDLGACGPLRSDLKDRAGYCGLFRTPTLRNVALRGSFFHNGVFHALRDVVAFYATRDTDPARWYPKDAHGRVRKFDDLPKAYRRNVKLDAPFKPMPDGRPRLSPREIDDIVAFLQTLSDGYRPQRR